MWIHVQVRDLAEGAAVSQELPLALSAEAYTISAELRPPPPPPPASPRGKPGSPRPAASPRSMAAKPQTPTEAGRQAQQAAVLVPGAPPASPRGKAPKAQAPAEAGGRQAGETQGLEPCDPAGPLLDYGVLRARDAAARPLVLANTGRHAIGFSFSARTQVWAPRRTGTLELRVLG